MKRLPVYLVLLVVLGVIVLIGGMSFTSEGPRSDPARISSYKADFRVDAEGDLHARETITVDFPLYGDRHGIFRFFDHRDENAAFVRREPHDIKVTLDGRDEDFEILDEGKGRYTNVKIGSAHRTVSGAKTYVIEYVVDDVLLELEGGQRSRFYWNLIPSGWQMAIDEAELSVTLPAEAMDVRCHVGAGETGGCEVSGEDTSTVTVEAKDLSPHTPVTLDTDLDLATPEVEDMSLWPVAWDGVLGPHTISVVGALLLGALAGLFGYKLSRSTREKSPGFPLLYAPPEGIGPAQAAYLLQEKVETRHFVASLMHAAEQGVVDFTPDGSSWRIAPVQGAAPAQLDEITTEVLQGLGADRKAFVASPSSVKDGEKLKEVLGDFKSDTASWAEKQQLMSLSGLGPAGSFVVIAAFALAGYLSFAQPLPGSLWAIVPGLFGVFGYEIALTGAGTRRTPQGRDLWSRVGGFHRILSTPSAEARFDFSGRRDLYTAYIPWAVAFGCADTWAQKFRVEVGEEPPAPRYWAGSYNGVHTGAYVSQMVDSFDRTVDSAISSYQATQRSSSGGGGGGSFGGGGGGGGGGGSW